MAIRSQRFRSHCRAPNKSAVLHVFESTTPIVAIHSGLNQFLTSRLAHPKGSRNCHPQASVLETASTTVVGVVGSVSLERFRLLEFSVVEAGSSVLLIDSGGVVESTEVVVVASLAEELEATDKEELVEAIMLDDVGTSVVDPRSSASVEMKVVVPVCVEAVVAVEAVVETVLVAVRDVALVVLVEVLVEV